MNPFTKRRVTIFSGPNFLALSILEYLLSKNFNVRVISGEKNKWLDKSNFIALKDQFTVESKFTQDDNYPNDYTICVYGFDNNNQKFALDPNVKTVILVPFEKFIQFSRIKPSGKNVTVIYLGDLLGPRIDLNSDLEINRVLKDSINKRVMSVAVGELYYPVFILDVVKEIFSTMFSFGPVGHEVLFVGNQTSSRIVWNQLRVLIPDLSLKFDTDKKSREFPANIDKKVISSDLRNSIVQTVNWVSVEPIKKERPKITKKPVNKYLKIFLVIVSLFMLAPPLMLLFAATIYYSTYKSYDENKLLLTRPFLVGARETSRFFSSLPLIGKGYKELEFSADIALDANKVIVDAVPLLKNTAELSNKILGNDIYSIKDETSVIDTSLRKTYEDLSFMEADVNNNYYQGLSLEKRLSDMVDFEKIKSMIKESSLLSQELPNILGQENSKTYLFLFQNNMELRPTGGFVGSYGLATFENGRMTDLGVSDVYSADGQLKGHVEPPLPIKQYLGEANWYLRDSNWDPDFPTSAKRAEWFLDKEIGKDVDGVVAIDLSPIKDILKITGPVFLSDFNMDVSAENIYEKTQEEVERNFFAGSRKKASFLTALSRNLLDIFAHSSSDNKLKILQVFYNNLEERHIQAFVHNDNVGGVLSRLNWDGSVKVLNSTDKYYADTVGVVEANLGVNKVNQFITRKINLEISTDENYIYRKLTLTIDNSANPSLGPSGKYKNYVRILKPEDTDQGDMGQLVEVLPDSSQTVIFNWKSQKPDNFDINNFKLYVRKQAGIDGFPFSLTINGKSKYNGDLSRDLFINY